ncbi:hypothetical protein GPALN_012157 [Globodera pallida]|nr:hypothetical protein GPALN_012157 [Globodera pallida]
MGRQYGHLLTKAQPGTLCLWLIDPIPIENDPELGAYGQNNGGRGQALKFGCQEVEKDAAIETQTKAKRVPKEPADLTVAQSAKTIERIDFDETPGVNQQKPGRQSSVTKSLGGEFLRKTVKETVVLTPDASRKMTQLNTEQLLKLIAEQQQQITQLLKLQKNQRGDTVLSLPDVSKLEP